MVEVAQLRAEIVLQIGKRLRHSTQNDAYQSPLFFLRSFPLDAAKEIYRFARSETTPNGRCHTWHCEAPEKMAQFALDLENLPRSFFGAGRSRLLRIGKDKVARTMATIITIEISHVKTHAGFTVLYINFRYAIIQDNGEMHLPKLKGGGGDKVPCPLNESEETRVRQAAHSDLEMMADFKYPLSNEFMLLLGRAAKPPPSEAGSTSDCEASLEEEEEAAETSAMLAIVAASRR